jgi:hypothetical protein
MIDMRKEKNRDYKFRFIFIQLTHAGEMFQTFTCPTEKNGERRFSASIIMFGAGFDLWPINAREPTFIYVVYAPRFPLLNFITGNCVCDAVCTRPRTHTNINLLPSLCLVITFLKCFVFSLCREMRGK